jgi:acyl-CoA thioester hydrolase
MIPLPFKPEPYHEDDHFVRDRQGGLVWHRVKNRVLYIDTDRSGVVYHSNYLRYFELGRVTLMRHIGFPYAEVEANGYVYPVVSMGVDFHRPLYYDDPMWIYTRPDRLEKVKVSFAYLVTNRETGEIICTGHTVHCALNEKRRPCAVDPQTVSTWQNFPK